jgi:hypothetical protein
LENGVTLNPRECAVVGGSPDERLRYAIRLRRLGFATFAETRDSKRRRMFQRACEGNYWGKGGVYDLDDAEDRAWLDRDDLAAVGV